MSFHIYGLLRNVVEYDFNQNPQPVPLGQCGMSHRPTEKGREPGHLGIFCYGSQRIKLRAKNDEKMENKQLFINIFIYEKDKEKNHGPEGISDKHLVTTDLEPVNHAQEVTRPVSSTSVP